MKIVAMLKVRDEEDIISETIENLIDQQIDLVILDNGSTDKTYEICKRYEKKDNVKLLQVFGDMGESNQILRILYDMTLTLCPDWIITFEADAFFETGQNNLSLREGIEKADRMGYNLIQFDRFDFFITDADDDSIKSVKNRMKYYSYQNDFQYRVWKFIPGVLAEEGGHYPTFPKGGQYKIFPTKFVLRHYPFRNKKQMENKIKNRIETTSGSSNYRYFEVYQKINEQNFSDKVDHSCLAKYNDDNNWSKEKKFCPYVTPNQPKKEEIFSNEGFPFKEFRDSMILKRLIKQKNEKIKELRRKIQVLQNRNSD